METTVELAGPLALLLGTVTDGRVARGNGPRNS